jgi:hypothetical protein
MRPSRHKALVDKAVSACLAAIEIYNKPLFPHREEVFTIMMTNAWELLLKARLLKEGGNKMRAIYEVEASKTKAGQPAKRPKIRLSRAGNPRTITLDAALAQVTALKSDPLPAIAVDSIQAIEEIRNNAIHFINVDKGLAEKV